METAAGGPVTEGNVGGGTGMICMGFKGGIGTASRKLPDRAGGFTVGVLVQCNFGQRRLLRIAGAPVGAGDHRRRRNATRAPASTRRRRRNAARCRPGVGQGPGLHHRRGRHRCAAAAAPAPPRGPPRRARDRPHGRHRGRELGRHLHRLFHDQHRQAGRERRAAGSDAGRRTDRSGVRGRPCRPPRRRSSTRCSRRRRCGGPMATWCRRFRTIG